MRTEEIIVVNIPRWRPGKQFIAWVRAYGVWGLSRSINVQRQTIYDWLNGIKVPLESNARAMRKLSRRRPEGIGPLTLDDIFGPEEEP